MSARQIWAGRLGGAAVVAGGVVVAGVVGVASAEVLVVSRFTIGSRNIPDAFSVTSTLTTSPASNLTVIARPRL